ncbi:hypothetical protein [Actinomadura logoneensis]|uniref:hypothetical protein n=1 Tax=Actinomadura logoneensis TaxID=2293572 RepID=UPI0018F180CD|nr:hypothetical protein [Actinomadura logoneensis]
MAVFLTRVLRLVVHTAPATSDTARPVPRWILRLAYALPVILLPSCLWRLPFALHFDMGQRHDGPGMPGYWISIPYVVGLSVVSELIAFLCIGLVRGWGEVTPGWLPLIGGRRVRPLAAVVPAVLGGLILTLLFTSVPLGGGQALTFSGVVDVQPYDNGWWKALAAVCTGPVELWGPIVLVLAIAYYVRRRGETAPETVAGTEQEPGGRTIPTAVG